MAQTSSCDALTSIADEILRLLGPVDRMSTGRLTHRTPWAREATLGYRPAGTPAGTKAAASMPKRICGTMLRLPAPPPNRPVTADPPPPSFFGPANFGGHTQPHRGFLQE
eukprot:scaffold9342_cov126-Isochrysis_galbana.AAC.6